MGASSPVASLATISFIEDSTFLQNSLTCTSHTLIKKNTNSLFGVKSGKDKITGIPDWLVTGNSIRLSAKVKRNALKSILLTAVTSELNI